MSYACNLIAASLRQLDAGIRADTILTFRALPLFCSSPGLPSIGTYVWGVHMLVRHCEKLGKSPEIDLLNGDSRARHARGTGTKRYAPDIRFRTRTAYGYLVRTRATHGWVLPSLSADEFPSHADAP